MKPTIERIRAIRKLLDQKTYESEHDQLPRWRHVAHFWIRVFKSFQENRGPVRASSLAYTTILSLVPILAVFVSISTGMLQQNETSSIDFIMNYVVNTVAPQLDLMSEESGAQAENRQAVVQKIKDYINAINSGTLGLTAGIALVFIAISVLSSIENTFNDIWGVTRGRTWSARIVQYWAAITLAPIFMVTAVGLTSIGQIASSQTEDGKPLSSALTNQVVLKTNIENATITQLQAITNESVSTAGGTEKTNTTVEISGVKRTAPVPHVEEKKPNLVVRLITWISSAQKSDSWFVAFFGRAVRTIIPSIVLMVFLMIFYRLMPATQVRWDAAAIGGAVGGGLLQLNNLMSVIYLSRVVSYSKIYGSLGAVPIFLLGLYFSWLIILLGAQVAYAYQNRHVYMLEKQAEAINQRGREFVALRLMTYIAHAFYLGEKPPTRLHMAEVTGVPSQLAAQVLAMMVTGNLLIEVNGSETGYAPARPIEKISVEDILCVLRAGIGNELATADDPVRAVLREEYERVVLAEMHAAGAVTLQNLVTRLGALPETRKPGAVVTKMAAAAA